MRILEHFREKKETKYEGWVMRRFGGKLSPKKLSIWSIQWRIRRVRHVGRVHRYRNRQRFGCGAGPWIFPLLQIIGDFFLRFLPIRPRFEYFGYLSLRNPICRRTNGRRPLNWRTVDVCAAFVDFFPLPFVADDSGGCFSSKIEIPSRPIVFGDFRQFPVNPTEQIGVRFEKDATTTICRRTDDIAASASVHLFWGRNGTIFGGIEFFTAMPFEFDLFDAWKSVAEVFVDVPLNHITVGWGWSLRVCLPKLKWWIEREPELTAKYG